MSKINKEFVKAQMELFKMRAMYQHAEIVSGAYKLLTTQRGRKATPDNPNLWVDLTNDEKLKESMARMDRHLQFVAECVDLLGTEE